MFNEEGLCCFHSKSCGSRCSGGAGRYDSSAQMRRRRRQAAHCCRPARMAPRAPHGLAHALPAARHRACPRPFEALTRCAHCTRRLIGVTDTRVVDVTGPREPRPSSLPQTASRCSKHTLSQEPSPVTSSCKVIVPNYLVDRIR